MVDEFPIGEKMIVEGHIARKRSTGDTLARAKLIP